MDGSFEIGPDFNVKDIVDSLLPDGTSDAPLARATPPARWLPGASLARRFLCCGADVCLSYDRSPEASLSQAALVQSRLRNQLRETRDEIAFLRAELDKDQSSNRIQIIQELIVVST